jgi:hypothetical protein
MQDSPLLLLSLFLIEVYGTILLNGAVRISGALGFKYSLPYFYLYIFPYSPANPQELFNLCHASARNIIKRIFSILKNQFAILQHNSSLRPGIQAHLPAALAAIHNVIRRYDADEILLCLKEIEVPEDINIDELDLEAVEHEGELARGPPNTAEKRGADERRDDIAERMWIQYQQVLESREMTE